MFDFVGKKRWFFLLSSVVIICGIIFAAVGGITWGIEFTGGTMMTVTYEDDNPVSQDELEATLEDLGYDNYTIQHGEGDNTYLVRLPELDDEQQTELKAAMEDMGLTVESFDFI